MEDDVSKKGALFLQQQRFGKRWRKMWCVLFRESHCSVSRLEIYDWNERTDKSIRRHQDSKKVIRLSSCIRVSPVDVDSAPKDTSAFLLETTEKIFVFAADRLQADEWTQRLCEIAFPTTWSSRAAFCCDESWFSPGLVLVQSWFSPGLLCLFAVLVQDFRVLVRRTEASERCRLKGEAVLKADADALILIDRCGQVLFSWPYRYLRRFGRDKSSFSFEAGRRCDSGEGSFEFDTKVGNALFAAVETAINRQRMSLPHSPASTGLDGPPPVSRPQRQTSLGLDSHPTHKDRESSSPSLRHHLCRLEPPVDKTLTAVKSLTLENRDLPVHRKNQVKMISSCPLPGDSTPSAPEEEQDGGPQRITRHSLESEYSQPFDLVIPDLRDLGGAESERPLGADPLYDSIDEFQIRTIFHSDRTDHIYDEPEGCQSKGTSALYMEYSVSNICPGISHCNIMYVHYQAKGHTHFSFSIFLMFTVFCISDT
uniref:Docking protein 2 n=1 Tax=Periophthalmus magnuspinnatus TaxID=409849 RepID=A0A3B3ZCA7_9GOBI